MSGALDSQGWLCLLYDVSDTDSLLPPFERQPDHEAATRKRNLQNKEVPVPDAEEARKAEKVPVA